jgi:hypothetical protein
MRFTDFLKATVMTSAAAATLLAAITAAAAGSHGDPLLVPFSAGWWVLAAAVGTLLGRRAQTSPPIARLLAGARSTKALPELHPTRILLNRLWPLLLCTVLASGLALVLPQIAAIATGFAIIWALSWRRQDGAVAAIEERDGVRYYVERTSPVKPIQLLRTPGFKANTWTFEDVEPASVPRGRA